MICRLSCFTYPGIQIARVLEGIIGREGGIIQLLWMDLGGLDVPESGVPRREKRREEDSENTRDKDSVDGSGIGSVL